MPLLFTGLEMIMITTNVVNSVLKIELGYPRDGITHKEVGSHESR